MKWRQQHIQIQLGIQVPPSVLPYTLCPDTNLILSQLATLGPFKEGEIREGDW